METTIRILKRVEDSEYGLLAYNRQSSLEGCECRVTSDHSPHQIQWTRIPILWGYKSIPKPIMPSEKRDAYDLQRYVPLEIFRECYADYARKASTGAFPYDHYYTSLNPKICTTIQEVTFMEMTNNPPHPYHTDEGLLLNAFNEKGNANLYTFHCSNKYTGYFLSNDRSIFEVEIL